MKTLDTIGKIKQWVHGHERLVTSGAFMGGFVIDLLTLTRIDQWFDNAILFSYLFLATIAIIVINTDIEERLGSKIIDRLSPLMLYVAQFAFGGLLSGFVIFYTQAASWYVAWPFLIALYILFLANDRLIPYYRRIEVQTAMLFGALFAMMIFFVPTILQTVGDGIFVLSGIISIAVMILFLQFLYWFLPTISETRKWRVRRNVFVIYTLFNILYFTHVIPPIPLSLKHVGVYHDIVRLDQGNYSVDYESYPWYQAHKTILGSTFHKQSDTGTVYVLSSIFAPNKLSAPAYHKWQWFNPRTEIWQDVHESGFELLGGRDGGFRWYSYVDSPAVGMWRVRITASHDREIGRIVFDVTDDADANMTIKTKDI